MGDKLRLCIAGVLLATVGPCLSILSFSRFRKALLCVAAGGAPLLPGSSTPDRIAWAVDAADSRLPGSRTCLVRSLATEVVLQLYGHTPCHRIGINRTAGTIEAHSWVEYEGRVLIGDLEGLSEFDSLPSLERK